MRELRFCKAYQTKTFDTPLDAINHGAYEIKRFMKEHEDTAVIVFELNFDAELSSYYVTYVLEVL